MSDTPRTDAILDKAWAHEIGCFDLGKEDCDALKNIERELAEANRRLADEIRKRQEAELAIDIERELIAQEIEKHTANTEGTPGLAAIVRARIEDREAVEHAEEREDDHRLIQRLGDLLARTAVALRGPEPPLRRWSYHDVPERAAASVEYAEESARLLRDVVSYEHISPDARGRIEDFLKRIAAQQLGGDD